MKTLAEYKNLIIFNLTYILVTFAASLYFHNVEFISYALIVIVLGILFLIAHARVHYPKWIMWGMTIWGFFHLIGGLVPSPPGWPISGDIHVLYSMWFIPGYIRYDHIIHAYGFGLVTFIVWHGLKTISKGKLDPTFGVLLACATAAMGFGSINEIIEFIISVSFEGTNVGGYVNNSLDLVANATGAIIAATIIKIKE